MTVTSRPGDGQRRRRHRSQQNDTGRISPEEMAGDGGGGDASNVHVMVRVRPENEMELTAGQRVIVRAMDEHVLVFDPKEEVEPNFYHGKIRRGRDITKKANRDLKFAFDYVFGPQTTNTDVFEQTTRVALDRVLEGYNSSVFAYGATGAGKTHTMLGKTNDPGVTFLTMMDLYKRIDNMKNEKTIEVAVSYLEVYNEQIKDLLLPTGSLPMREDPKLGVVMQGLSLHKPQNAEELMHMLAFGNQNRTQHATDANSESSRSHAVFQVFIRQRDRTAHITANVKVAKMSLIDLAGSERATATKNMGARFREGANINCSLLALGNVINALSEHKVKGQYVPYRNSKLTRLLKDSLGGNCQTVMIAAVSPSAMSYEDTYNTLKYADRAKHIKAVLKKNVVSVDMHVSRYAQIVGELQKEIKELKQKVKNYEDGSYVDKRQPTPCSKIVSLQETLYKVFTCRISIRKELLEFESSERDMHWKILRKERSLSRLYIVDSDTGRYATNVERIRQSVEATKSRLSSLLGRKEKVKARMVENCDWLKRVEDEMSTPAAERIPEILEGNVRTHHLEVELTDCKRYNKYLKKVIKAHDREAQSTDRLIVTLLQTVKKQYYLLKGQGMTTSDVVSDYEHVQRQVDGDREVVWADQADSPALTSEPSPSSISRLLDFPVLSCVRTTPITPVHSKNRRIASSPTSVCGQYVNTPKPDPAHVLRNSSGPQQTPTGEEKTGNNLRWNSNATKIPQSREIQRISKQTSALDRRKSLASFNSMRPAEPGDTLIYSDNVFEDDNSDHTLTELAGQTPAAKVFLVTHPHLVGDNSGNTPGDRSHNATGMNSAVTSQATTCHMGEGRSGHASDETFVLHKPSSGRSQSSPGHVDEHTCSTNLKTTQSLIEKAPSLNTSYVIADSKNEDSSTVNSASVTKQDLNSRTVTKSSQQESKDGVSRDGCSTSKDTKHVNRAIRFGSSSSPPASAPLSFADAVKSPCRPPLRSLTENCMSPLAQPLNSPRGDCRQRTIPRLKFTSSEVENSPEYAEQQFSKMYSLAVKAQQNITVLKRVGLPSVVDGSPAVYRARRVLPGYMQTTKSVSSRSRVRTLSHKDTTFSRSMSTARRETANHPLHKGKAMFRSKSAAGLRRA